MQLFHLKQSSTTTLWKKYVFVPADKASNIVVIVWCKYYIKVLGKEITHSKVTYWTETQIVDSHYFTTSELSAKSDHIKVPTIYWLPKLHKNPFKFRFITASSKCSTTRLSFLLSTAHTNIKTFIINYSNKCYENTSINYFWSVKNSLEVTSSLHFCWHLWLLYSLNYFSAWSNQTKFKYLINWSFKKSGCKSDSY
jgi:hypothetical protein